MVRGLLRGDDATNSARATMRRLVRCSEERRGAMALSSGGAATFGHARTSTCTPTSHTHSHLEHTSAEHTSAVCCSNYSETP